jgi:sporulation protein YlmC with PRC-barrel domain
MSLADSRNQLIQQLKRYGDQAMKYEGKLTVLAGCLALLLGTAQAQNPARDTDDAGAAASNEYSASLRYQDYLQGADLRASQVVGAPVRNMEGENLGEIEELVIGAGDRMMVVLTVGGFLGVGEKRVAVPYDELRVSPEGDTFFVNRSRATLESEPAYTYRERTSQAGSDARDAQLAARAQSDNRDTAQSRSAAQQRTEQAEDRAEAQEQRAARAAAAEAERRETTITRDPADAGDAAAAAALGADDHRASTIIGATVVDSAGEDVGEIDDLVVSSDTGDIQAVLSIGGVAGIGAKLVAVPFDDLQIASGDGSGDDAPRLRLDMNAQQARDTLPEFRYERQVAQGSATNPRG